MRVILFFLPVCALAQPGNVKKASKSVISVSTFKADGSLITTTSGVVCGEKGIGISSFKPFVGATTAIVTDINGKTYEVETIVGADELYDVCKFTINNCNIMPLKAASAQKGSQGSKCYMLSKSQKKDAIKMLTVKGMETFEDSLFSYSFNEEFELDSENRPVVNENGDVLGLMRKSANSYEAFATDIRKSMNIVSAGLMTGNPVVRKTTMRVALPADHEQARLMLMMLSSAADSIQSERTIDDYILRYPDEIDGYANRARIAQGAGNMQYAYETLVKAEQKVAAKDEVYYELSSIIFNKVLYYPDSTSTTFTLQEALNYAEKAWQQKELPIYLHKQAQIVYYMQDYNRALQLFEQTAEKGLNISEVYFEQAQCKENLGAEFEEVLLLLDKSVEVTPKPLTGVSAPYILARAQALDNAGRYRQAIQDYNRYDSLMMMRASAEFYYTRYRCEANARLFQQAINDIAHAVYLSPSNPTFIAELASINLRVGRYEDALKACDMALALTTVYPDVYIVQGVALVQLGHKEEAREAFLKAKALDDERAEGYLKKYGL